MSRTTGAVIGKQSGKLGDIYGAVVHGHQTYRAMPTKRPKSYKPSAAESDRRERFKTLTQLASVFNPASKVGFDKYRWIKPFIAPFNYFTMINKEAVIVMGGEAEVDFGSIKLAKGTLPQVGFGNADFTEPLRVTCTWQTTSDFPGADAQDKVWIVIYQPDTKALIMSFGNDLRNSGTTTVRVPSSWTGLPVHVFGFAIGDGRENKGEPSDSTYIGTGTIA